MLKEDLVTWLLYLAVREQRVRYLHWLVNKCLRKNHCDNHYRELLDLRVLVAHRKYRRSRSRPHLIDHIFGARITLILLFASLFY